MKVEDGAYLSSQRPLNCAHSIMLLEWEWAASQNNAKVKSEEFSKKQKNIPWRNIDWGKPEHGTRQKIIKSWISREWLGGVVASRARTEKLDFFHYRCTVANSSVGCTKGSTWSRRVSADQQTKTHFPPQWSHTQLAPTHIYSYVCAASIFLYLNIQKFFGRSKLGPASIHSKSEKVCGTAFSVKKYCGKSAGHFWPILGHSWAILGIFGHVGSYFCHFGSF